MRLISTIGQSCCSARRGSNPRRPAWENEHSSAIQQHGVHYRQHKATEHHRDPSAYAHPHENGVTTESWHWGDAGFLARTFSPPTCREPTDILAQPSSHKPILRAPWWTLLTNASRGSDISLQELPFILSRALILMNSPSYNSSHRKCHSVLNTRARCPS